VSKKIEVRRGDELIGGARKATSLSPRTEERAADIDAQKDGCRRDCQLFKLCRDLEPALSSGIQIDPANNQSSRHQRS